MRRGAVVALGLGLGACKGPPEKPATSTKAEPALVPRRPSDGPLAQMPFLQLPDDPSRAEKIALGHLLFFDTQLSGHGDRSCYSCHQNENGTGGKDPLAIGTGDKVLARHSPTLWNVGYFVQSFYWDGRAATLEENTRGAWGGPNMGAGADALDAKAAELAALPAYKKRFVDAFGDKTQIKADQVAAAISEYMRTLVCTDTAYDRLAAGEKAALTDQQKKGFDVFAGKGRCATCHAPPYFTTAMGVAGGAYFNVGIGTRGVPEDQVDRGRATVTNDPRDWASFKPPSLRNVTKSAPYFHDGSVATLDQAVRLMAKGGIPNKNLNPASVDAHLTDTEIADVLAFLSALECPGTLVAPAP
jgi:cytochrome c peroxidase